jgi:subtilisin family serine protease
MDTNYIILKNKPLTTGDPFSRALGIRGTPTTALPKISVEVKKMKLTDVARETQNEQVVATAPAMPMKLVAPRAGGTKGIVERQNQKLTWGVQAVGADTSPFNGDGVVVAILDTGIDASHPAFQGVELIQQDFTGEGNGDGHGHGTHCAGTVFGRDVNGVRIGVATGVKKALIGKVLGAQGGGSSDQICNAILWAIDNGAEVISMSLGMDFPGFQKQLAQSGLPPEIATSQALEGYRKNVDLFESLAALIKARAAFLQPVVIVAAAGNESHRERGEFWELGVSPPAIAEGIISVGAVDNAAQGFTVAEFSNTGVNLSAPGVDVVSAAPGARLVSLSGTSMATPHVAGVAALWIEKLKGLGMHNGLNLTARLIASSGTEAFQPGFDPVDIGAGLVGCPQE